jgi:hypothetical protein
MDEPPGGLYFAYGSHLDPGGSDAAGIPADQAEPVGLAYLPDHGLAFHHGPGGWDGGVLDVTDCTGVVVWGRVYRLGKNGWDQQESRGEGCHDPTSRESVVVSITCTKTLAFGSPPRSKRQLR